jgi:hypothetical protein
VLGKVEPREGMCLAIERSVARTGRRGGHGSRGTT